MKASDEELARLASRLGLSMARRNETLSTAESCTGGWVAKCVTDIAGSSAWFETGFVTYGNQAKIKLLGVSKAALACHGAVSREVVHAMARGAILKSGAGVAIAVTGIAGPGGAVPGKPVGTVWFCWALRRGSRIVLRSQCKLFRGDRETVRRKTVENAFQQLLRILRDS